jgi:hypothetical protein
MAGRRLSLGIELADSQICILGYTALKIIILKTPAVRRRSFAFAVRGGLSEGDAMGFRHSARLAVQAARAIFEA